MKKLILVIMISVLLCSGIIYGVNLYKSEDIQYQPSDSSWEVSNVSEAINSLYNMTNDLNTLKGPFTEFYHTKAQGTQTYKLPRSIYGSEIYLIETSSSKNGKRTLNITNCGSELLNTQSLTVGSSWSSNNTATYIYKLSNLNENSKFEVTYNDATQNDSSISIIYWNSNKEYNDGNKFKLVTYLAGYGGSWVGGGSELYNAETGELIAYAGTTREGLNGNGYAFSQSPSNNGTITSEKIVEYNNYSLKLVSMLNAYGGSWVFGRTELYDSNTGELLGYVGADISNRSGLSSDGSTGILYSEKNVVIK